MKYKNPCDSNLLSGSLIWYSIFYFVSASSSLQACNASMSLYWSLKKSYWVESSYLLNVSFVIWILWVVSVSLTQQQYTRFGKWGWWMYKSPVSCIMVNFIVPRLWLCPFPFESWWFGFFVCNHKTSFFLFFFNHLRRRKENWDDSEVGA